MNKIILALCLIAIALIGAGAVAAADAGNATTVDNTHHDIANDFTLPDSANDTTSDSVLIQDDTQDAVQDIHTPDNVQSKISSPQQIQKVDTKAPVIKNSKDVKVNYNKNTKADSDKEVATSVADLYKTHTIDSIGIATGLTHAQVVKMIKDIKAGTYGKQLQKTMLNKDKKVKTLSKKDIATSVAVLYKTHTINSIVMATGLTHAQVVKMIKDIKAGTYGKQLQKTVLNKDQKAKNKKMAEKIADLYGINSVSDISAITGLTYNQVVKMIKDIKTGVYGKQLQNHIFDNEIVAY